VRLSLYLNLSVFLYEGFELKKKGVKSGKKEFKEQKAQAMEVAK
jgi:hypothetical protein